MAVFLNNGHAINEIRTAITLINGLQNNIIEYNNLINIINRELYYLLKNKTRYIRNQQNQQNLPNQPIPPSRDDILCALINKLDGFYIKTPEVKKIINYLSYITEDDMEYTWFIKNIEKGYNPTGVVLMNVIPYFKMNNIEYLYNKYSSKIKSNEIFTFRILYNNVFGCDTIINPVKVHEIFTKFKLSNEEICKIIEQNSYTKSYGDSSTIQKINNYLTNIINYKKQYTLKFTFDEMLNLLNWLQMRNLIIPIFNEKYEGDDITDINITRNNFKNILNHFTSDELIKIISINLVNTGSINGISNIQLYINFIIKYCSFDKIKKSNICELLKVHNINRFSLGMLEHLYDGDKDIELIEYFLTYKINEDQIFDLIINKNFIACSNDELFNLAFEKGNINIIKYFINKKFTITEDMILKNYSEKILDILVICAENGFYITEKCFPHIVYVLYINSLSFDYNAEKIKNCSIYVNDNEEFEKHKKTMKEICSLYNNLEYNVLNNFNNTIQYLKNNPVTKELIVLSSNKSVREYLINKMTEEREKTIKKVVVKKIVKKVIK